MQTAMYQITRAGTKIATIRASDVPTLDRARYELAQMHGVHAKSILRGKASQYSDGCIAVWPVDTRGKPLGRPYMFAPYTFSL